MSSIRRTSCFPYHSYVEHLSVAEWENAISPSAKDEFFAALLHSGKLRVLDLVCSLPKYSAAFDQAKLSNVTDLRISFGQQTAWLRTMIPLMSLTSLEILSRGSESNWDVFTLPPNTLRILKVLETPRHGRPVEGVTSFLKTFFVHHYNSLSFIELRSLSFSVDFVPDLPNLLTFVLRNCEVRGWETLCKSFSSLKHLILERVNLFSTPFKEILLEIPSNTLRSIESLDVRFNVQAPGPHWLDASVASLTSLRKLCITRISIDTLTLILVHCLKLEEFSCKTWFSTQETRLTDTHLEVLSQLAARPLHTVRLSDGNFTSTALSKFIAAFPASVECLELSRFRGLTPQILQAMLRLPLRELTLDCMEVPPQHRRQLESIWRQVNPPVLKTFRWPPGVNAYHRR